MSFNYSIRHLSSQPGTIKSQITDRKCYAKEQLNGSIGLDELSEHISSHGGIPEEQVVAVIHALPKCIVEHLKEGKSVNLGAMGVFTPRNKSKGEHNVDEFSAADITKVDISWKKGPKFKNLRDLCDFQLVASRADQAAALKAQKDALPHSEKATDDGKTNVD